MGFDITLEQAQEILPEFNVLRRLNLSGEKAAFEAIWQNKSVALKIYNPHADVYRLQREIYAMMTISSPYVIQLIEYHQKITPTINVTYLLEEFIRGQELGDLIKKEGLLSPELTIKILKNILQGLSACWEKKIVHRDIKPNNIMISNEGSAVIIDFGIARHVDEHSLTQTGAIMAPCTPPYASPEVLENRKTEVDARSDLFSLGVTAYYMLTGEHPLWTDTSFERNIQRMINDDPIPPNVLNPNIPEDLSKYVLKLMNRQRFLRFGGADQALDALSQLGI